MVALALVALATLTSCEQVGQPCTAGSTNITCRQLTVGGLTRKFFYHVPTTAAPAAGRPVVLYFHGDGGTGNANLTSLYAQTDPDGAVVVQLDGPNNVPGLNRGSTAWSFFMNASSPDDVGFTKTVLDHLQLGTLIPGVPVDMKRVYAVGASRGGFMVDTLIVDSRTAGSFAGVVNVAGNFYCESGDTVCTQRTASGGGGFATSAPVLHIHGDNDTAVPSPAAVPNPVTASINWPWPVAQFAVGQRLPGHLRLQGHGDAVDRVQADLPVRPERHLREGLPAGAGQGRGPRPRRLGAARLDLPEDQVPSLTGSFDRLRPMAGSPARAMDRVNREFTR